MGLRNKQKEKIAKKIILNKLQDGIMPDEENVKNLIVEYFNNYDFVPGEPSLKVEKALSRTNTNKKDYNKMLDLIKDDLDLLYENILNQNKKLIKNFNYFDSEKEKAKNKISKLKAKTEKIINKVNNSNNYYDTEVERFYDFKRLNMKKSNAFIDLDNNEVSLPSMKNMYDYIDLKEANISIKDIYPGEVIKERQSISNIENAIDGFVNSSWQYEVKLAETKETQNMNVEFEITLEEEKDFSQIQITPNTLNSIRLFIDYRKDNEWIEIDDIQGQTIDKNKVSWDFEPIKTNKIKVRLEKSTPDMENNRYIFGISNIMLMKKYYVQESKLVTEPFEIGSEINNFILDKLSIKVEDEIPKDCSIDYFIQYGTDKNNLSGKMKIEPFREDIDGNIIDLENTTSITRTLTSEDLEEDKYLKLPHSNFYRYNGIMEHNAIQETIRTYRGDGFWLKETYQNPTENSEERAVAMSDWNNIDPNINKVTEIINDDEMGGEIGYDIEKIYETTRANREKDKFYLSAIELDEDNSQIEDLSIIIEDLHNRDEVSINDKNDLEDNGYKIKDVNLKEGYIELEESIDHNLNVSYKAPRVFYKFSTWVYMDERNTYRSAFIDYLNDTTLAKELRDKGYHTNMFLNNMQIYKRRNDSRHGQYQYVLPMQPGWNNLIMIAYKHDSRINIDFANINARNLGSEKLRFRREKMNNVQLYNLRNKINPSVKNNFAIADYVVDNTVRSDLIFNNDDRDGYEIHYKYPNDNIKNKKYYCKITAILKTQNQHLTPKIKQIETNASF